MPSRIKSIFIALIVLVSLNVEAQKLSYSIRVSSLTSIDKLYSIDINSSEFKKNNLSIGGLVRGTAFNIEGMRLGLDYGKYRHSLSDDRAEYLLETYRIVTGKDFEVVDAWCRLLIGFELTLGLNSGLQYTLTDQSLSIFGASSPSNRNVTDYFEAGTIKTKPLFGGGMLIEVEKQLLSRFHIGLGLSLNIISVNDGYSVQTELAYNDNGEHITKPEYISSNTSQRSIFFDPIARIYIRF